MSSDSADDMLRYRVDWLETDSLPRLRTSWDERSDVKLFESENFPVWYFFALYDAVGQAFRWEDMHLAEPKWVNAFLNDTEVRLFTLIRDGWPQGFVLLDSRDKGICDIAYFGLVREAIGQGLGGWLLDRALEIGWSIPRVQKLTVNTCTLDHPRAKPLYMGRGFKLVRSEERTRSRAPDASEANFKEIRC